MVKEALGVAEMCDKSGFTGMVFLDGAAGEAAAATNPNPAPAGLYAAIGAEYYAAPMEEAMKNPRIQAHGARSREKSWVGGNMEGEGRQLGGMLVGGKSEIVFGYAETEWGDHAVHESLEELLTACRAVTGKLPKASL